MFFFFLHVYYATFFFLSKSIFLEVWGVLDALCVYTDYKTQWPYFEMYSGLNVQNINMQY